jgi:hypothetical protein
MFRNDRDRPGAFEAFSGETVLTDPPATANDRPGAFEDEIQLPSADSAVRGDRAAPFSPSSDGFVNC